VHLLEIALVQSSVLKEATGAYFIAFQSVSTRHNTDKDYVRYEAMTA